MMIPHGSSMHKNKTCYYVIIITTRFPTPIEPTSIMHIAATRDACTRPARSSGIYHVVVWTGHLSVHSRICMRLSRVSMHLYVIYIYTVCVHAHPTTMRHICIYTKQGHLTHSVRPVRCGQNNNNNNTDNKNSALATCTRGHTHSMHTIAINFHSYARPSVYIYICA